MAARLSEATEVQAVPVGFAPGSILLDRYEIQDRLGLGGCGLVLRARDRVLDHSVALKILRRDVMFDRQMEERLMREAHAISRLHSQHVVRIFDSGRLDDGAPYLVMEFLRGRDLGELVAAYGALAVPVAVDFVLQACEAIAEAHALGIVHRDIKPSNLFVVDRPDGWQLIKVVDFGISKSVFPEQHDAALTQTALMLGTPSYMSPEQMRSARSAGPRSDLWSLGAVLYELVEGRLPITADSFAELIIAVSTQPPAPMTRAPQLTPVIARCLAKDPQERYANVAELAADLARFTRRPIGLGCAVRSARVLGLAPPMTLIVTPPTVIALPRPPRLASSRRRRRLAVAGAIAAALAISAMMVSARRADRAEILEPPPLLPPAAIALPPPAAEVVAPRADETRRATAALPVEHGEAPAPVVAVPAPAPPPPPPPPARASPSPTTAPPPRPPKPSVRRKSRAGAASTGCDPYARPEGC